MRFHRLDDRATIPIRATTGSAGYDLRTLEDFTLVPGQRLLVKTGITFEDAHTDLVGFIKPKSGLAYKYGIDVLAGVIDSDYRDDIGVILINHGEKSVTFKAGNAVAQLVMFKYYTLDEKDVEGLRNGGYGSTGK